MMLMPDAERFDPHSRRPLPGPALERPVHRGRRDPTVPPTNDGLFWCMHTQTCIGPDGEAGRAGQLLLQGQALSRDRKVRVKALRVPGGFSRKAPVCRALWRSQTPNLRDSESGQQHPTPTLTDGISL